MDIEKALRSEGFLYLVNVLKAFLFNSKDDFFRLFF